MNMTHHTHKPQSNNSILSREFYCSLNILDAVYALLVVVIAIFIQICFAQYQDGYDIAFLWGSTVAAIWLGWFYKPLRLFFVLSAVASYLAVITYSGDISRTDPAQGKVPFLLKYFLSSQAAIMWLCALILIATFCYLTGLLLTIKNNQQMNNALTSGRMLCWWAAFMGFTGLIVRWHESYLISSETGHIPVSNLYEVFVLFIICTLIMYLYYEAKYQIARIGVFVLVLLSGAVSFLIWYTLHYQAQEIQPLVPALQSWWLKIHVPANFVGYGGFSIAAMLGVVQLLVLNGVGARVLPKTQVLEELMYKAISLGFLFFTIATIFGALWAEVAWGRYWGWDPKETWALITWLNYAVWLHLRLVKGWRGQILAIWAIVGLLITTFAFVGVNLFLGGLHSYGTL